MQDVMYTISCIAYYTIERFQQLLHTRLPKPIFLLILIVKKYHLTMKQNFMMIMFRVMTIVILMSTQ